MTTFQAGRFLDGGATNIGFATSADAGKTWRSGFLPHLSRFGNPAGRADRVSDPVVAYDAFHRTWLIASLGAVEGDSQLLISRSRDGVEWSRPVVAAHDPDANYDKEWIACDSSQASRHRGRCYLVYLDLVSRQLRARGSDDGGATWSAPVLVTATSQTAGVPQGAYPVVRPDGTLVVLFAVVGSIEEADWVGAARSRDGGASFERAVRVAELAEEPLLAVRAPAFPSADVDGAGRIYVVWSDCRFRGDCSANGLVLSMISSGDGGTTWSRPQRLNAQSMPLSWLAETGLGRMLGDYISTSFAGGTAIPVFSLAADPVDGEFRQAIFAGGIG